MTSRASRAARTAVAFVVLGLVPQTFLAPASASGTTLPFSSFKQMVVDASYDHVFVTAGSTGTSIAVMNFDGTLDTMIPNELGASGMVLVDGSLWVAAQSNDTIDEIDTSTLTRVHSYSTGTVTKPNNLILTGGLLWFSYGECGYGEGGIASMDPSDGTVTTYAPSIGFPSYCPDMAAFPSLPNTLFTWESGLEPPTINVYDVSAAPTLQLSRFMIELAFVRQVARSPDGSKLLVAAGYPYVIKSFRLSDLQPSGTDYPTGPYPTGVDVTTVGGGEIAAGLNAAYDADVYVFPQDGTTPSYSYDFSKSAQSVWDAGLAFSPDAAVLFAVTSDSGGDVIFNVLSLSASSSTTTSTSTSSTTSPTSSTTTTSSSTSSTSTSSTTTSPSSSTTTISSTTSTTTQPPTTTATTPTRTSTTTVTSTTTTLRCTTARCSLDTALISGACAGQIIPASVSGKLSTAENFIDQAATTPGKKVRKVLQKARTLLRQAGAKATRAAKGKKAKLSATCAAALKDTAGHVAADL